MISRKEFSRRRKQLMRMMGSNSIAIIPTAPERTHKQKAPVSQTGASVCWLPTVDVSGTRGRRRTPGENPLCEVSPLS